MTVSVPASSVERAAPNTRLAAAGGRASRESITTTEWRPDSAVTVAGGGFDRSVDEQAQAAESAVERGKRAAESGRHAVVVIDSLDALPPGVARRVFGAARATEEAGTLTVIASTGAAGEPLRQATTRIVLEPGDTSSGPQPPQLAPRSGTLRADLLK